MHRFWRGFAIFILGGLLGTGFGVALGFFIFPYVFPPPPANEQLTDADLAPPAEVESSRRLAPVIAESPRSPPSPTPNEPPPQSPPAAVESPAPAVPPAVAETQSTPAVTETQPAIPPATAGMPKQAATALVATGTFIHANRSDPVHWGRGRVSVYQRTVFLEADFEVGPGPAFHVYLVPKASIRSSADMKGVMYVDLGGLRSFKGSQRYTIPAGINLKDYPSVIIWCERFSVLISPADLVTSAR